jgi:hypothetical protein
VRIRTLVGIGVAMFLFLLGQFGFAQGPAPRPSPDAQYPGMQLTGQFAFTGAHPTDPLPNEPLDTRFAMRLTGESAQALFDHMKVDAKPPACDADARPGWREKRVGEMMCSTDGRTYQCFLVINIPEQKIEGVAC